MGRKKGNQDKRAFKRSEYDFDQMVRKKGGIDKVLMEHELCMRKNIADTFVVKEDENNENNKVVGIATAVVGDRTITVRLVDNSGRIYA
jgi:hypothetical protein